MEETSPCHCVVLRSPRTPSDRAHRGAQPQEGSRPNNGPLQRRGQLWPKRCARRTNRGSERGGPLPRCSLRQPWGHHSLATPETWPQARAFPSSTLCALVVGSWTCAASLHHCLVPYANCIPIWNVRPISVSLMRFILALWPFPSPSPLIFFFVMSSY